MNKFHEDRTKIVDFLLIVTFLASCKFLRSPSIIRKYRSVRRAARKFTQSSTLVVIVMTHILLTIPANVMYIYFSVPNNDISLYNAPKALREISCFTYFLYVIGHAINHILFCLTNKQVQKETGNIIMNCKNIYWTQ